MEDTENRAVKKQSTDLRYRKTLTYPPHLSENTGTERADRDWSQPEAVSACSGGPRPGARREPVADGLQRPRAPRSAGQAVFSVVAATLGRQFSVYPRPPLPVQGRADEVSGGRA